MSKIKLQNYTNEIFLLIIGIFLIIFPKFFIHGIVISIGIYLLIKHGILLYVNYKKFSKLEILINSIYLIIGVLLTLFSNLIVKLTSLFFALYLISQIITEIYYILVNKNANKHFSENIILLSLYTIAIILLLIFYKDISVFAAILIGIVLIFSQITKIISKCKTKTNKKTDYIDTEIIE